MQHDFYTLYTVAAVEMKHKYPNDVITRSFKATNKIEIYGRSLYLYVELPTPP